MPSSTSSAPLATALVCVAALGTTAAWAMASQKSKSSSANSVVASSAAKVSADAPLLPPGAFDVAVVGAGPAGATAAYYLAKGGARVALLEREKVPRAKSCHGALSAQACAVLKDMGVLAELHGTVLAVASSESAPAKGLHVERRVLDAELAAMAVKAGADLRRGFEVSGVATSFDAAAGMWTVRSTRSSFVGGGAGGRSSGSSSGSISGEIATGNEGGSIAARLLILADGSASTVGAELGFVSVIAAAADGGEGEGSLVAVPHPGDDVSAPSASRQRVASSGVPRSHGDHWMIVGEAADHTEARPAEQARGGGGEGEGGAVYYGIHAAMHGGKMAAAAALSMRSRGDFSSSATRAYEKAWRREFGSSIVDAWPRAARQAVESRSALLESLSGELRRLRRLASSKVSKALPTEALLKEKATSAAAAARTALESAAASAAAAARFGASVRASWSGDGGSGSKSNQEESTAEAATASVEVSLSPAVGKGGVGGNSNLAATLAAGAGEAAAA